MSQFILPKKRGLFRYSPWDAAPVVFAVMHLFYIVGMYWAFAHVHAAWPLKTAMMLVLGIIYAYSISWNINGISHNFIHNRYFNSPALNRIFSLLESVDCCFSQVMYDAIHRRHHMGNSDKPDPKTGDTRDWISIYRHGHDGHAENVWTFTFLSFFREDPKAAYLDIKNSDPNEARWALVELALDFLLFATFFFLNWKFLLFFVAFWYFGHCMSYLNGYYEHLGGNPDVPIAWGVSSYHWLYNFVWFNNGFHAEHHYRPRAHWTRMKTLRDQIAEDQRRQGTRVIQPPHAFGFLDPDVVDRPLVPVTGKVEEGTPGEVDLVDTTGAASDQLAATSATPPQMRPMPTQA